jgi:chemotaxis signal transduction protein
VLELKQEQLSLAPSFGTKIRADFIKYMGKLNDDNFIILLDVDNVLSIDELSVVHDVKKCADEEVEAETVGTENSLT